MTDPTLNAPEMPNRESVVEKVQTNLNDFNASIDEPDRGEAVDEQVESTTETTDTSTKTATEDSPADMVESSPAAEGKETPVADEKAAAKSDEEAAAPASTLPAAYRRTAKAREWTDEEIDQFMVKDPELALKTFGKMHESRVKEVNEWAALGRKTKESPVAKVGMPPQSSSDLLKPVDIAGLVEKFGNEELIEEMAKPINAAITALQPLLQQAQAAQGAADLAARQALGKMLDDFFVGREMKDFADFYGVDAVKLTPEQKVTRDKVVELADSLAAGAMFQGRQLSVEDALTLAHDSISTPKKEQAIREKIRQSVVTRQKSISLKPTHRGTGAYNGPPRSRQEMENTTASRLREVFG